MLLTKNRQIATLSHMLETILHQLGLGNKELAVYRLIVEHGKIAPALVGRLANINRTTVYSVAKELKDKGLIIEDLGGKSLYYLPAREADLEKIITREQARVKQTESAVHDLQTWLQAMPNSQTYSVPRIRFVDEADLENYLYEATSRWCASGEKIEQTWWGFQDHTFAERFEKWIDWFWTTTPDEVTLKMFSNQSPVEQKMTRKKYAKRRQIRFWDGNEFSATQWVVGEYLILIVTKQRPYYLVEIHDSVLSHNMRAMFKSMWEKIPEDLKKR